MGYTADSLFEHLTNGDVLTPGAICDFNLEKEDNYECFKEAFDKLKPSKVDMRQMSCNGYAITEFVRRTIPYGPEYKTAWDDIDEE